MSFARSPYHRSGFVVLSAFVLVVGFLFAAPRHAFAADPGVGIAKPAPPKKQDHPTPLNNNPVTYHGGSIQDTPTTYLVMWGNQWGTGTEVTNDPKGLMTLQINLLTRLYGAADNWSTSATQYCSGIAIGAVDCSQAKTFVGHPASDPMHGFWLDNSAATPQSPSQGDIAAEAVKAAQHFGVSGTNVQIIVDMPQGITPTGFSNQYCAWHSWTNMPDNSRITYTNMPYMTDAGDSCGANSVAVGSTGVDASTEGVTIVGGHEYGETLTDPGTGDGWTDDTGVSGETADKCAWTNMGIVKIEGMNFAVQPLWSNNANSGNGGCVKYYNSATDQG
ncbi:hypothetical protein CTZ27_12185 [Streptomyces griseocarneus]|nr:hypothetical protein CTZ27_12185 [Streptomyces griseocarneus]